MIIANKAESILKANEISNKLMEIIMAEIRNFECEDDPAENIYLIVHTLSIITSKFCLVLENYSTIYGIENMNKQAAYEWIESATKEYLSSMRDKMHD